MRQIYYIIIISIIIIGLGLGLGIGLGMKKNNNNMNSKGNGKIVIKFFGVPDCAKDDNKFFKQYNFKVV